MNQIHSEDSFECGQSAGKSFITELKLEAYETAGDSNHLVTYAETKDGRVQRQMTVAVDGTTNTDLSIKLHLRYVNKLPVFS